MTEGGEEEEDDRDVGDDTVQVLHGQLIVVHGTACVSVGTLFSKQSAQATVCIDDAFEQSGRK